MAARRGVRRLWTPWWVVVHVAVVVLVVGFLALGWWQIGRAAQGNLLSFGYAVEWPVFAAFVIFVWIVEMRKALRADKPRDAAARTSAEPGIGGLGRTGRNPYRRSRRRRAQRGRLRRLGRPGPGRVQPLPGVVQRQPACHARGLPRYERQHQHEGELMSAALTRFRVMAYVVGVLLLVLVFVAMPLKYFADRPSAGRHRRADARLPLHGLPGDRLRSGGAGQVAVRAHAARAAGRNRTGDVVRGRAQGDRLGAPPPRRGQRATAGSGCDSPASPAERIPPEPPQRTRMSATMSKGSDDRTGDSVEVAHAAQRVPNLGGCRSRAWGWWRARRLARDPISGPSAAPSAGADAEPLTLAITPAPAPAGRRSRPRSASRSSTELSHRSRWSGPGRTSRSPARSATTARRGYPPRRSRSAPRTRRPSPRPARTIRTQTQTHQLLHHGPPGPARPAPGCTSSTARRSGVAMPVVIEFDTEVPEEARAGVQRRLFVTTNPPQPGVWHWPSGRQVWYRAPVYWQPGTTISVRAALAGVPMGNGSYGDTDRSATVGRRQQGLHERRQRDQADARVRGRPARPDRAGEPGQAEHSVLVRLHGADEQGAHANLRHPQRAQRRLRRRRQLGDAAHLGWRVRPRRTVVGR